MAEEPPLLLSLLSLGLLTWAAVGFTFFPDRKIEQARETGVSEFLIPSKAFLRFLGMGLLVLDALILATLIL